MKKAFLFLISGFFIAFSGQAQSGTATAARPATHHKAGYPSIKRNRI